MFFCEKLTDFVASLTLLRSSRSTPYSYRTVEAACSLPLWLMGLNFTVASFGVHIYNIQDVKTNLMITSMRSSICCIDPYLLVVQLNSKPLEAMSSHEVGALGFKFWGWLLVPIHSYMSMQKDVDRKIKNMGPSSIQSFCLQRYVLTSLLEDKMFLILIFSRISVNKFRDIFNGI